MQVISKPVEFLWDKGNKDKNQEKHSVGNTEAEEVFFDNRKVIIRDTLHSDKEERFIVLGKTKKRRLLYIVFTNRADKIRIISARDLNIKERMFYEKSA